MARRIFKKSRSGGYRRAGMATYGVPYYTESSNALGTKTRVDYPGKFLKPNPYANKLLDSVSGLKRQYSSVFRLCHNSVGVATLLQPKLHQQDVGALLNAQPEFVNMAGGFRFVKIMNVKVVFHSLDQTANLTPQKWPLVFNYDSNKLVNVDSPNLNSMLQAFNTNIEQMNCYNSFIGLQNTKLILSAPDYFSFKPIISSGSNRSTMTTTSNQNDTSKSSTVALDEWGYLNILYITTPEITTQGSPIGTLQFFIDCIIYDQ